MSAVNFVSSAFINEWIYNKPQKITTKDAEISIAEWKNEGAEVPPALTPTLLSEIWNSFCNE